MDNDPDYVNELPTYLYWASPKPKKTGSMAGAAPCTTGAATPPGKMPRNTLARNAACGPLAGATWLPWGPWGMQELGQRILSYAAYAIKRRPPFPASPPTQPAARCSRNSWWTSATENPWRRFTRPCWPGTSLAVWTWARFSPRTPVMPYTASATPPPRRTSTPCAPRCTIF